MRAGRNDSLLPVIRAQNPGIFASKGNAGAKKEKKKI